MKRLRNERGIALVTALLLTMMSLAIMAAVLVEHGGHVGQLGSRRPDQLGNHRNHELTLQLVAASAIPGVSGLLNAIPGHAARRARATAGLASVGGKRNEIPHLGRPGRVWVGGAAFAAETAVMGQVGFVVMRPAGAGF